VRQGAAELRGGWPAAARGRRGFGNALTGYSSGVTTELDSPREPDGEHSSPSDRKVAVVAHRKKTLAGGLPELRRLLAANGIEDVLWYEVPKSKKAGKMARKAVEDGASLIFVWGGDGTVQRCVDALAGSAAEIAIVPAGTANLLARNLGIPTTLRAAVETGLRGGRRKLDLGEVNGEHFAVMAGTGLDAAMIQDADRGLKDRIGRLSYIRTMLAHIRDEGSPLRIEVDGVTWFDGRAACALLGNVSNVLGGVKAFDDARPDSGVLEIGVVTASSPVQWVRTLSRVVVGRSDRSPFVRITRGKEVVIKLSRPSRYELDGGARKKAKRLDARVVPAAITVCVP
jgi:diacylglycerol kinase (ATP)